MPRTPRTTLCPDLNMYLLTATTPDRLPFTDCNYTNPGPEGSLAIERMARYRCATMLRCCRRQGYRLWQRSRGSRWTMLHHRTGRTIDISLSLSYAP